MRPAWPNVAGRTFFSFTRASAFRPGIRSKSIQSGIAFPLLRLIARDVSLLALEIARVLDLRFQLRCHVGIHALKRLGEIAPTHVRPLQAMRPRESVLFRRAKQKTRAFKSLQLILQPIQSRTTRQSHLPADLRQPQVRIVVPQGQPMLRARGEHAIRLLRSPRHEVVD